MECRRQASAGAQVPDLLTAIYPIPHQASIGNPALPARTALSGKRPCVQANAGARPPQRRDFVAIGGFMATTVTLLVFVRADPAPVSSSAWIWRAAIWISALMAVLPSSVLPTPLWPYPAGWDHCPVAASLQWSPWAAITAPWPLALSRLALRCICSIPAMCIPTPEAWAPVARQTDWMPR